MNLVFYFAKLQKKIDNKTYLHNFFRNLFVFILYDRRPILHNYSLKLIYAVFDAISLNKATEFICDN